MASSDFVVLLSDDCSVLPDWLIEDDELRSVDCCAALVLLATLWSPLPTFTPGLTLAAALMSVLLMPTFAFTPTLGLTVVEAAPVESIVLDDCVPVVPSVVEAEPDVLLPRVLSMPEFDPAPDVPPAVALPEVLASVLALPERVLSMPEFEPAVALPVLLASALALPESVLSVLEEAEPVLAVLPVVALDSAVPDESEPVVALVLESVVPGVVAVLVLAWVSGMQSTCTGLAERSLAIPVSLSASLPACG